MYEKKPWLKFYGDVPEHIDYPRVTMYEALMQTVARCPDVIAYDFFGTPPPTGSSERRSTGAPMPWPPSG